MLSLLLEYGGAIGLSAADSAHFAERVHELIPHGEYEPLSGGRSLVSWRDASRAALSILLDENRRVVGVIPFLEGTPTTNVRLLEIRDAEGDFDAPVLVELQGQTERTPVAALVQDLAPNRERLVVGEMTEMALIGLARNYVTRPPGSASRLTKLGEAESTIVSTGLRAEQSGKVGVPLASAILRGKIADAEKRMNRTTRTFFQRCRISVDGVDIELVAPYNDGLRAEYVFTRGDVVEGSFVLVGTLDPTHHDYTMPVMRR